MFPPYPPSPKNFSSSSTPLYINVRVIYRCGRRKRAAPKNNAANTLKGGLFEGWWRKVSARNRRRLRYVHGAKLFALPNWREKQFCRAFRSRLLYYLSPALAVSDGNVYFQKARERECSELASLSEKPKCQSITSAAAVYDSETEPQACIMW